MLFRSGTGGQKAYTSNARTGALVAALAVNEDDSCIGITAQGKALRFSAGKVSRMGRAAFGVRILNMTGDDSVIGIARQPYEEEEILEEESVEVEGKGEVGVPKPSEETPGTSPEEPATDTSEDGMEIY